MRTLLRRLGKSDIYARHVEPELRDDIPHIGHYGRRDTGKTGENVLLYHASIGEQPLLSFLVQRPERLVMHYHNVTPAHFFEPWHPQLAKALDEGRRQLAVLRPRVAATMAASHHNATELHELGYRDVAVVPPILDFTRLARVEPHEGTMRHFAEAVTGPVVLFVGQLLPHKRPDLLVQVGHLLATYHDTGSQVVLVGTSRIEPYHEALLRYLRELNLPNVWLTGRVDDEQLAAFYRSADAFLTMSEHEGFCIPLVEAMALDLPVVARDRGAVAETMGHAGVLLPADAGPELATEAVLEIARSPERRRILVEQGRRRLAAFDPDHSRATFLATLLKALE